MAVLMYALESWVMAVVGMAWLSLRSMYPTRSLMEEYLVYGQGALATVHLLMLSLSYQYPHMSRSYFCVTLAHLALGTYAMVDSLSEYMLPLKTSATLSTLLFVNQSSTVQVNATVSRTVYSTLCCPNANWAKWNRQVYFGGSDLYLAPMAVTLALQTVHVILAAAALSSVQQQSSLWPGGASLGYTMLTFAGGVMALKFMYFFTGPCPSMDFDFFQSFIVIRMYVVLGLIVLAFPVFATIENLLDPTLNKLRMLWNLLGLALASVFVLILILYVRDKNMLSYPWAVFYGLGGLCVLYSLVERGGSAVIAEQGEQAVNMVMQKGMSMVAGGAKLAKNVVANQEKNRHVRARFVLPINTNLMMTGLPQPGAASNAEIGAAKLD